MIRQFNVSGGIFTMEGKFYTQLQYIVLIPLFFLGFSLFYNPLGIVDSFSTASRDGSFHLLMVSCIIMGVLSISRTMLYFVLKASGMQWLHYISWCIAEILGMSLFMALYSILSKNDGNNYFQHLSVSMKYCFLIMVFIYVPMALARLVKIKNGLLVIREQQNDNSLVRFYDEHQRLKLTIAPSSLLYVKSDYNYIRVNYMDSGKVKEFVLRASMKSLESPSFAHCLTRCHRSYFVNPEHVTVLRKGTDGFIYAEMNSPEVPAVPVSKQYYDKLSELL